MVIKLPNPDEVLSALKDFHNKSERFCDFAKKVWKCIWRITVFNKVAPQFSSVQKVTKEKKFFGLHNKDLEI